MWKTGLLFMAIEKESGSFFKVKTYIYHMTQSHSTPKYLAKRKKTYTHAKACCI
jgi:hypothetical protein